MFEAGLKNPGTMAAVVGLSDAALAEVCRDADVWIANLNCPGQTVISGETENIKQASVLAKDKGAKYVFPLQVSGAFHTPLMQSAADGLEKEINQKTISNPSIPVIGNTRAQLIDSAEAVKTKLLEQVCSCVQWQRTIEYLLEQDVTTFVEIGPGNVLSSLVSRIDKDAVATIINIGSVEDIERAI